jgi:hypothetical protein
MSGPHVWTGCTAQCLRLPPLAGVVFWRACDGMCCKLITAGNLMDLGPAASCDIAQLPTACRTVAPAYT